MSNYHIPLTFTGISLLNRPLHCLRIAVISPLLLLFINLPALPQCTDLYGVVTGGGIANCGAIFKTDDRGENPEYVYSVDMKVKGVSPYGDLCQASNGKMYGMTRYGGKSDAGVIFEFDPETGEYTDKFMFDKERGANPLGSLIQAKNGRLYGFTSRGGAHNCGVLFEWDPETEVFSVKYVFSTNSGANPNGSLVQAKNGILYGLTYNGGQYDRGVLFSWDPATETFISLINFDGYYNGGNPNGSLMLASNNKLYGVTQNGGNANSGILFEFDPSTNFWIKKAYFTNEFCHPPGTLLQATNGKFYGMTNTGGRQGKGVIFEWDPSANILTKKIEFEGTNGAYPWGRLIQTGIGKIYGMTTMGGLNNSGVLFEWDPVTGIFAVRHDFEPNNYNKGGAIFGSLVQAGNGKLYGMNTSGGIAGKGTIFQWDPETGIFKDTVRLYSVENGRGLCGSPVQAGNGKLYGLASDGGAFNMGIIYEFDPVKNIYTKKIDFNGSMNGRMPQGAMVMAGNKKLYGVTQSGGGFNTGVLFEYVPETNTLTNLHDFDDVSGITPFGFLIMAKNGKIYGSCAYGGKYGRGVIYELDPATNKFTGRFDFPFVLRSSVQCAFSNAPDGKLIGIRDNMLFEWDPIDGSLVKKLDFNRYANGEAIYGPLVLANDHMYYGMAEVGGSYDLGIFFKWNPSTNVYTKIFDFDGPNYGKIPFSTLIHSRNGKILGMTMYGGKNDEGVLFEWDYNSNTFTKKIEFDFQNGCRPFYGGLVEINHFNSSSSQDLTACDKYNFNGRILTSSGTYYDTIPNSAGCDSLITLNLTIHQRSINTLYEKACSEYNFNGRVLKTSGTYVDIVPNAAGCDSIIVLFLTVLQPTSSGMSVTVCNEYQFGNKRITQSGIYRDTLVNSAGCDSVITLDLTINRRSNSTLYVSACDSYISPSGRYSWTRSGTYTDTIPNVKGCDSIITVRLICPHGSKAFVSVEACDGYVSPSGRYRWTTSGKYVDNIQNAAGCDSAITVDLTIQKSTAGFTHQDACDRYTSPSGLYTWTSSGTYSDIIPNTRGCDSILTIDLVIDHVDTAIIQDRSVLISKDKSANHQWIDCDNENAIIPGETFLTYTGRRNGHYAVIISNGACIDTSSVYEILLTGITDPSLSRILLYPNPTSGFFTIDLGRTSTSASVTIMRYDGEIIWKENMVNARKVELDLDGLPGLYLVTILEDDREVTFKVIKE